MDIVNLEINQKIIVSEKTTYKLLMSKATRDNNATDLQLSLLSKLICFNFFSLLFPFSRSVLINDIFQRLLVFELRGQRYRTSDWRGWGCERVSEVLVVDARWREGDDGAVRPERAPPAIAVSTTAAGAAAGVGAGAGAGACWDGRPNGGKCGLCL